MTAYSLLFAIRGVEKITDQKRLQKLPRDSDSKSGNRGLYERKNEPFIFRHGNWRSN
jgi:hypothetical protein